MGYEVINDKLIRDPDGVEICTAEVAARLNNRDATIRGLRRKRRKKDRLEVMVQSVACGGSTTSWIRDETGGAHTLNINQTMEYAQLLLDRIDEECKETDDVDRSDGR